MTYQVYTEKIKKWKLNLIKEESYDKLKKKVSWGVFKQLKTEELDNFSIFY